MQLDSHPERAGRILAHRGDEELVLLDPENGQYFTLDEVGARIWELCDGSRSVSEIAGALDEEFDAPLETIRADLLELLEELSSGGLVLEARA